MSKPQRERKVTVYSRPPELEIILEDGPAKNDFSEFRSTENNSPFLPLDPHNTARPVCESETPGWNEVNRKSSWRHASLLQKRRTGDPLSQLKVCTTKLNLPTRRPSYLAWKKQHLDTLDKSYNETKTGNEAIASDDPEWQSTSYWKVDLHEDRDIPFDSQGSSSPSEHYANVAEGNSDMNKADPCYINPLKGLHDDGKRDLNRRRQMIDQSLVSIREDLVAMRNFDQALAKTLMTLRRELHQIKISRYSHAHRELIDEAMFNVERDEVDDICDLPPRLFSPDLKHYGVTKMNVQTRRFSVF